MTAIRIQTTVDEATAEAIPALRPFLGQRVELVARASDDARLQVHERLQAAADAGRVRLPADRPRADISERPPVSLPGRPLSEVVIEDRR